MRGSPGGSVAVAVCGIGFVLSVSNGAPAIAKGERTLTAGSRRSGTAGDQARTSVWDGVYSEEQTKRGQHAYRRACGHCHRDDLSGGSDGAPSLLGSAFDYRWRNADVGQMLEVMSATMPLDAPATLTVDQYVDIIAFVFKMNGIPAGTAELPPDADKLRQIFFTERPLPPG